ncbi:MAG: hypothetical protein HeimAB125_20000, partial [Candidatus Heimdallarchaeota archaeon AB_125]
VMNGGYTVGIMADMALEELALAGVTALTLGASSGVTLPAMAVKTGLETHVWLDINNGMDRTGISPGEKAIDLYKMILLEVQLAFRPLISPSLRSLLIVFRCSFFILHL